MAYTGLSEQGKLNVLAENEIHIVNISKYLHPNDAAVDSAMNQTGARGLAMSGYMTGRGISTGQYTPTSAGSKGSFQSEYGLLPGRPIGGIGTPISMPPSVNPNVTAETYAMNYFGGNKPSNAIDMGNGAWRAQTGDTWVTYRPAGTAGNRTAPSTASVNIDGLSVRSINNNKPLKLKFPSQ